MRIDSAAIMRAFCVWTLLHLFAAFLNIQVPHTLYTLVARLYVSLHSEVSTCGLAVASMPLASGMNQGCSMLGSIIALCLDPLVRCCIFEITFC